MAELPSQIGKYPVLRLLGQGAMGKVYLGEDPFIGRQVAIKVLSAEGDEEAQRRFLEEARTVGQLSHPNIVTLLEFGFHEGNPFLVMELLKGESLEGWLRRPHPLPELLRVLRDLGRAVAFAHQEGVLHRDIKPSNAQVLQDGTCKLMDFGIARSQRMKLTATGMVVGTPQFIAPEVLRDASYTSASDTYAVGLVAYQALAGFNPFAALNLEACLAKVLTLEPPPLGRERADLPAELAELIDACLVKDPSRRPPIQRLLQGFERALQGSTGQAAAGAFVADTAIATYALPKTATAAAPPRQPARPYLRVAGFLAVAVVALVGLAFYFFGRGAAAPATGSPPVTAAQDRDQPAGAPALAQAAVAEPPADAARDPAGEEAAEPAASRPEPTNPPVPRKAPSLLKQAAASAREAEEAAAPPVATAASEKDPTGVTDNAAENAGDGTTDSATESATDSSASEPEPAAPNVEPVPPARRDPSGDPPAPAPGPILRALSPSEVRRGSSVSLELLGEFFGPDSRVLIRKGRDAASGLEIRKIRRDGPGRLVVTLFVDPNAPLGWYSLEVAGEDGRTSGRLNLEVGL